MIELSYTLRNGATIMIFWSLFACTSPTQDTSEAIAEAADLLESDMVWLFADSGDYINESHETNNSVEYDY